MRTHLSGKRVLPLLEVRGKCKAWADTRCVGRTPSCVRTCLANVCYHSWTCVADAQEGLVCAALCLDSELRSMPLLQAAHQAGSRLSLCSLRRTWSMPFVSSLPGGSTACARLLATSVLRPPAPAVPSMSHTVRDIRYVRLGIGAPSVLRRGPGFELPDRVAPRHAPWLLSCQAAVRPGMRPGMRPGWACPGAWLCWTEGGRQQRGL